MKFASTSFFSKVVFFIPPKRVVRICRYLEIRRSDLWKGSRQIKIVLLSFLLKKSYLYLCSIDTIYARSMTSANKQSSLQVSLTRYYISTGESIPHCQRIHHFYQHGGRAPAFRLAVQDHVMPNWSHIGSRRLSKAWHGIALLWYSKGNALRRWFRGQHSCCQRCLFRHQPCHRVCHCPDRLSWTY